MNAADNVVVMFLSSFLGQAVGYFAVVGLLFLIVWRWGEKRFAPARVQAVRRVDGKQLRFEVKNTLMTLASGALTALVVMTLYRAGLTRLSEDATAWPAAQVAAMVVGLIVFNDLWFYGVHRLLHTPWLFRRVHAVHHRSVDVNPFSSYSFHIVEAVLLGAWVLPSVMLVPMYLPALAVVQAIGLANNVMSHLGYEFYPRWLVKVPLLKLLSSSTYHNMHHTQYQGNYALFFRFWDRVFGTELPDYERRFVQRGAAHAASTAYTSPAAATLPPSSMA